MKSNARLGTPEFRSPTIVDAGSHPGERDRAKREVAPRVAIVSAQIPPEYSGAGYSAYKYARRLERQAKLAFLLTRTDMRPGDRGNSLPVTSGELLGEVNIVRVRPKLRMLGRRDIPLVVRTLPYVWDLVTLLGGLLRALFARRREYDIVHCFSPTWMSGYAALLGKLLGKRVVIEVTLLGKDDPVAVQRRDYFRLKWYFKQLQFRSADAICTISPALAEICIRAGYPSNKIAIVPRSVNTSEFKPLAPGEALGMRRKLGLPKEGPLLLFVGGVIRRKGADLLLPIYTRVRERFPDANLVLVGRHTEDPESERLAGEIREGARRIGADDRVRIVAPTQRLQEYMQAADLFLFPSRREGFGTVVPEAMACGLPVVALGLPGITDFIITSAKDGFIIAAEDPDEFARICMDLLSDRTLYERISSAAVASVFRRFSEPSIDGQYARVYGRFFDPGSTLSPM